MPRRVVIAACALALATSLLLAAGAVAKAPRDFFGVSATEYPSGSEFQRVAQGGARTVRVQFYWGSVEPTPGAPRDWSLLDAAVADAARSGTRLLPLLLGSPPWVSDQPVSPPIYSGTAEDAWSRFLTDLALRYGSSGSFWSEHPELPRIPITDWQLWNEVNLRFYWGSTPSPRRYGGFVKLSSRALRAGDRAADLILAGLIPYKTTGAGSVAGDKYLVRLMRVNNIRRHFDAIGVHPYGRTPRLVLKVLRDVRRELARVGVRKPIWVTEVGWSTGGQGWSSSPLRASPAKQARFVTEMYRQLRKQRKRIKLERAFYFSLRDTSANSSWLGRMGLFDLGGEPKPAWFAYARAAGGTP